MVFPPRKNLLVPEMTRGPDAQNLLDDNAEGALQSLQRRPRGTNQIQESIVPCQGQDTQLKDG